MALQIIPTISRSPALFYEASIAFTDHFYRFQVSSTVLRSIHGFYRSFLPFSGQLYCFTEYPQLLQIILTVSRSPVLLYFYILLQISPTIHRSLVLLCRPSIAFTDHSYHYQVICTIVHNTYSVHRSYLSFTGYPSIYGPSIAITDPSIFRSSVLFYIHTIHSPYKSFLPFTGHLYHLTDHTQLLQIIPTIYRSCVPLCRTSMVFTDHSYHLQVIHTILQTIHCPYRSFLLFISYSYCLQTMHSFCRSLLPLTGHTSFLSFSGRLQHFTGYPWRLLIIPTSNFTGHPYCFTDHCIYR